MGSSHSDMQAVARVSLLVGWGQGQEAWARCGVAAVPKTLGSADVARPPEGRALSSVPTWLDREGPRLEALAEPTAT